MNTRSSPLDRVVQVALGDRGYPIHIGDGMLLRGELIARHLPQPRAAIISDTVVAPLYLSSLIESLKSNAVEAVPVVLEASEERKDWSTLNLVFDALLAHRCERKTALIALGGGVIGDITGFAAATYQRGVPFIQIPTTLLAQVDSSVGGKTAVNHPRGKNMIGAFYQPLVVVADTATLATLPKREIAAGIAEVIKYGLIRDVEFFLWLEQHMEELVAQDPAALGYAVERSCRNKAEVAALDEREESGERAKLNFGHTFGHAIEAGMGYGAWLHGEAVAVGMVIAARISRGLGLIDDSVVNRIVNLLSRANLPMVAPDLGLDRYLELMGLDKKVDSGRIRFILLRGIGDSFLTADVSREVLAAALADSVQSG